jgi:hypothetical protein
MSTTTTVRVKQLACLGADHLNIPRSDTEALIELVLKTTQLALDEFRQLSRRSLQLSRRHIRVEHAGEFLAIGQCRARTSEDLGRLVSHRISRYLELIDTRVARLALERISYRVRPRQLSVVQPVNGLIERADMVGQGV